MIKIQLYNSAAGSLTVIPDAEGTEDFEQTLKRSDATDGIVFEYSLDLQFNKVSKAYLRDVFDLAGGIEAVVIVNIFEYRPNAFKWEQIGAGTIKYTNADISAERFKTSIEQTGLVRKVLNLLDTDLDLETVISQGKLAIPATPYQDLTLHSKAVIKQTISMPGELVEHIQEAVFDQAGLPGLSTTYRERVIFGTIDTTKNTLKELKESFGLGWGWTDFGGMGLVGPASLAQITQFLTTGIIGVGGYQVPDPRLIFNMATLSEAGIMDVITKLKLKHEIIADPGGVAGDVDVCGTGALGEVEINAWYEHRNASNAILTIQHLGAWAMPNCGGRVDNNKSTGVFEEKNFSLPNIAVSVGDKIYVYTTTRIYGNYQNVAAGSETVGHTFKVTPQDGHFINLSSKTVTPATTAKAYMVYEALNKTFQFYTDQVDCFRSTYFGRTDSVKVYPVDGPGSLRAILSGANIRQVLGKTTFVSGKEFHGALNAIDCLGLGFETREGRQVVVIEPLSYFYNKESLILDLGPVSDFHRIVDVKQYANQIELNYGKIDIQKTNGIDDPNGLRRWKYPITQVSTKQLATTKYKVSPYEIEDQRRLISSTEDSKNDDNNFFIDLIRVGLGFKPRIMEGFTLVENLFSPETTYNLNLSPRRNLDNWLKVVAISLYKSINKVIDFSYGEGNYFMRTQKTTETAPKPEGGPGVTVDLTGVVPLYYPERYKFNCPFSSDQMALTRATPYGYFIFQEYRGGPNLEGFLSKVTRDSKKKLGSFELLKVAR